MKKSSNCKTPINLSVIPSNTTVSNESKPVYETPVIDVIKFKLEKGFANSSSDLEDGGTWE